MFIALKVVWEFVKRYWGYLLGGLAAIGGVILYLLWPKSPVPSPVIDPKNPTSDIDNEDKKINDAKKNEEERQKKAQEDYDRTVSDIQKKYEADERILTDREKTQIQQILDETSGNPDELTRRLSKLTGIPVGDGK